MNHSTSSHLLIIAGGFLLAASVSLFAQSAVSNPATNGELASLIRLYQTDRNGVSRFYDLPWSEARFDRMEKLFKEWQERLAAVDFDALGQAGKIDYILLRGEIHSELSRLTLDRRRLLEMDELLAFRGPLQELEQARWRMEPVDSQAAATKISALAEQVKKLQKRVENVKKSKSDAKSK